MVDGECWFGNGAHGSLGATVPVSSLLETRLNESQPLDNVMIAW